MKFFDNQDKLLTQQILTLFENTLNQETLYDARLYFNENIENKKEKLFEEIYLNSSFFSTLTPEDLSPVNEFFTTNNTNRHVIEYFAYNDTIESNFLYWYGDRYNIYEIAISQNSRYISSLLALQDNPSAQEDNRSYQTYRWNSYVDYLKNNNSDNSEEIKKLKKLKSVNQKDVLYCLSTIRAQQREVNKQVYGLNLTNTNLMIHDKTYYERKKNKSSHGKPVSRHELSSRYANVTQSPQTKINNIEYEFFVFAGDMIENYYVKNYRDLEEVYYLGEIDEAKAVYEEEGFYEFIKED